jgi:CRP-like cAMP-binding protein
MISKGYVDVVLRRAHDLEEIIAHIGPGQYFGEVSMLWPGRSIAGVRAALHASVEVVALSRAVFAELISEAQAMREAVVWMARERLAENALKGGPGRRLRDALYA